MNILLTNDDSFRAEGILTLESVLRKGGHDVCTVAPHTQQSAKSHSMTVHGDMIVHRYDERHYSLEGTPADCVIFSIRSGFIPFKVDCVISGINHGYNLSRDTLYSGTCAAARQGAMYSIPSIAVSAEKDSSGIYDFLSPSEYLLSHLEAFVQVLCDSDSFLSLNFPPDWNGSVRKADLGIINYVDNYVCSDEGEMLVISSSGCSFEFIDGNRELPGDMKCTSSGAATASIIKIDPVIDREKMSMLVL